MSIKEILEELQKPAGSDLPEMYSVILSNPASKDLTGIAEYIAADNP